ncbi:MAG: amidinotransferase [Legionellales bacterium]|nr:amidinotransferase [Legionellales bacterium]
MQILMCQPDYYDVVYEINPWMKKTTQVNRTLAQQQWQALYETIQQCGARVELIPPQPQWPDMVFTANAALVHHRQVYLTHFRFPERQGERGFFKEWFLAQGYEILGDDLSFYHEKNFQGSYFEGAGDALFAGEILFVAHGFRSDKKVYQDILEKMNIKKMVLCELIDSYYYHLDTCFCPLNDRQAIWWPQAFSLESQEMMQHQMELFSVPEHEAKLFACNAVVIANKVIIPSGCVETQKILEQLGCEVYFCDMSEFIKAGGACKCLTLAL